MAHAPDCGSHLPRRGLTAGQAVLYLSAEDGLVDTLRPRLDAAGADCTSIHALTGWRMQEGERVTTGSITLADMPVIAAAIATYRPALVILDPLQAYLGAKTDMHRANEVRPLLAELVLLAEQYDCAMVCVRHLSKAPQSRAIYRGLGSIDFTAAARSVLLVGEEPHTPHADDADSALAPSRRVLAHSKSSLAPHGPSLRFTLREGTFSWVGTSPLTANELAAGTQRTPRRDTEVQKAEAWLCTYLRSGPRLAKAGAEEAAERRASFPSYDCISWATTESSSSTTEKMLFVCPVLGSFRPATNRDTSYK